MGWIWAAPTHMGGDSGPQLRRVDSTPSQTGATVSELNWPHPARRRHPRTWLPSGIILLSIGLLAHGGCSSTIPSKYLKQAEPGVTLTALSNQPGSYAGKVVILGGVVVEERRTDSQVWLHVKNRPLDVDYHPHRDASGVETESGHYWVVLSVNRLPPSYKDWARLTVVGKVMQPNDGRAGSTAKDPPSEPVLGALYLKGWGYGLEQHAWEASLDANYLATSPLVLQPIQAR